MKTLQGGRGPPLDCDEWVLRRGPLRPPLYSKHECVLYEAATCMSHMADVVGGLFCCM